MNKIKKFYKRFSGWNLPNKFTTIALILSVLYIIYSEFIKEQPLTNEVLTQTLSEFGLKQNLINDTISIDNYSRIDDIEFANESIIENFIKKNRNNISKLDEIKIPITFHLVGDTIINSISDLNIQKQIEIIQKELNEYGFNFSLKSVRKYPSNFFGPNSLNFTKTGQIQNIANLVDNSKTQLNVVLGEMEILGLTSFPFISNKRPKNSLPGENNWIIQNYNAFPGGSMKSFNTGKQLIHSIGHWLGLYHVFQDECDLESKDDYVLDTPKQKELFGKPDVTYSCDSTEFAQIHNFMQQVDDDWMKNFTPEQINRMKTICILFKPQFIPKKYLVELDYSALEGI